MNRERAGKENDAMKVSRHAERIITQTGADAGLSTGEYVEALELIRRIDAFAGRYQRASELSCSGVAHYPWETTKQFAERQECAVKEADTALQAMDEAISDYGAQLEQITGVDVTTNRDPRGAPITYTKSTGEFDREAVSFGNRRAELQSRWERDELARHWLARRVDRWD